MYTRGLTVGKRVVCDSDAREVWQGRVAGQVSRGNSPTRVMLDLWRGQALHAGRLRLRSMQAPMLQYPMSATTPRWRAWSCSVLLDHGGPGRCCVACRGPPRVGCEYAE